MFNMSCSVEVPPGKNSILEKGSGIDMNNSRSEKERERGAQNIAAESASFIIHIIL